MSLREIQSEQDNLEFSWGYKLGKGGVNNNVHMYESFTFDGVEYSLFDCVYMWRDDLHEPNVGKLVKVWETPSHKKKVKTVWFFRPNEISNWLGDVKPLENELFLASGEGVGVFNINPLESICGKCEVVCTSDDRRNLQASEEELKKADYIFYRTFDVGSYKISKNFSVDSIAGHQVEHFFNKRNDQKLKRLNVEANLNQDARKVGNPARAVKYNYSNRTVSARELETASSLNKKDHFPYENTGLRPKAILKPVHNGSANTSPCRLVVKTTSRKVRFSEDLPHANEPDMHPSKKRMLFKNSVSLGSNEEPANCADLLPSLPDHIQNLLNFKHCTDEGGLPEGVNINTKASTNIDNRGDQSEHQKGLRTLCQAFEVSKRPDQVVESNRWFKHKLWQERFERAQEKGCLVLLENLDPSRTSEEVEDIIWHTFQEKVNAKMIQHYCFSSPHNGQALIICKSKDVADSILSELDNRCLMLDNQRPILAHRTKLRHPDKLPVFLGHLPIDRLKPQKQHNVNAVSTSHYTQQNTIEYEMAAQWQRLQKYSTIVWDALHKQHAIEISSLVSRLKLRNTN